MRIAVVTFPGSNCDYDCYHAAVDVMGADAYYVWHRDRELGEPDAVILPGGFSYGDYLRAGAIARFSPIMDDVVRYARAGGPVLGICNGFQILCEVGLLPGALVRNRSLEFRSHDVLVRVENADTPYTHAYDEGQVLRLPIAHGEGNYIADEQAVQRLESEHRVIFRYVDANGEPTPESNPNGSVGNVAGIADERGSVLALMPHPERAVDDLLGSTDGVALFESLRRSIETGTAAGAGSAARRSAGAGTAARESRTQTTPEPSTRTHGER